MKPSLLSTLLFFLGLCSFNVYAEEPRLHAEIQIWEGPYSPDNLGKNWFASTATGLRFRLSYLDGACEVEAYQLRIEGNLLLLARIDRTHSCSKEQRPYVLKGEIENLAPGKYQLRVERKNAVGSVLVPFEKEIVVGGKW